MDAVMGGIMSPKIIAIGAIIAGVLAALWAVDHRGYTRGAATTEAAYAAKFADAQKRMIAAAERASRAETERLAAEAEADKIAKELEDEALRDPSTGCGLPLNRVLRLQKH